jgi:hypothetical protein
MRAARHPQLLGCVAKLAARVLAYADCGNGLDAHVAFFDLEQAALGCNVRALSRQLPQVVLTANLGLVLPGGPGVWGGRKRDLLLWRWWLMHGASALGSWPAQMWGGCAHASTTVPLPPAGEAAAELNVVGVPAITACAAALLDMQPGSSDGSPEAALINAALLRRCREELPVLRRELDLERPRGRNILRAAARRSLESLVEMPQRTVVCNLDAEHLRAVLECMRGRLVMHHSCSGIDARWLAEVRTAAAREGPWCVRRAAGQAGCRARARLPALTEGACGFACYPQDLLLAGFDAAELQQSGLMPALQNTHPLWRLMLDVLGRMLRVRIPASIAALKLGVTQDSSPQVCVASVAATRCECRGRLQVAALSALTR